MTASATLLGEAELHGLVDGHLEVDRRADVLRKLAASPADRALVEAWQEQNDLIRAAFRDVEREVLPVALDLAPPRLRCIDGDLGRPLASQPLTPLHAPLGAAPPRRRGSGLATVAAILVIAVGLVGSWLMIDQGREDDAAGASAPQAGPETALADRATAALGGGPAAGAGVPATRIPDLAAAGLRLVSVSTQATQPSSMVLQYRDTKDGRVVLGISSAPDEAMTPPEALGKTLVWRRSGAAYALAGTLPMERLRTLARSLQNGTGTN